MTRRKRPTPTPWPLPAPCDGLTPRETLAQAALVHPLLLEYIASPPRVAEAYEVHTHIGFGTLESEAA